MPKGSKTCPSCGHNCGPRSFVCVKCGSPFTFKNGSKPTQADIRLSIDRAKEKSKVVADTEINEEPKYLRELSEYFISVEPTLREKELYGNKVNVYESKCGKYRARQYSHFFSVPARSIYGDMEAHETTPYYSLSKYQPNNFLALVKRFDSVSKLIDYHEAVIKGEKEEVLFKPQYERKTRGERALRKRKQKRKL